MIVSIMYVIIVILIISIYAYSDKKSENNRYTEFCMNIVPGDIVQYMGDLTIVVTSGMRIDDKSNFWFSGKEVVDGKVSEGTLNIPILRSEWKLDYWKIVAKYEENSRN